MLAQSHRTRRSYLSRWIILSSGFSERLGDSSGTRTLWRPLRKSYTDEHTCVMLRTWQDDWDQLAELIRTEGVDAKSGRPRIVFAGYSYGGGYAFSEFAQSLQQRGLYVDYAVLCDAIYYCRWPSWLLRLYYAATDGREIQIPKNVGKVRWYYQRQDWIRGHRVVPSGRGTDIAPRTFVPGDHYELNCDHIYADDQLQWHDAVWRACREVLA